MLAAQNGHEQVARDLLKAGAVVGAQNNKGWTALMFAAQNGHEQVALVLLEAGAAAGFRVLIVAAFHGHMRCARVLLKQKAKGFWCSRWCMGSLHLS